MRQVGDRPVGPGVQTREFKAGEKIFAQGSSGSRVYFIEQGEVEIYLDGKFRVVMHSGDFFGEIGALTGLPRTGTAVSLTATRVLVMEVENLRASLENDKSLRKQVLQKLSARLFHARNRSRRDFISVKLASLESFFSSFEVQELEADQCLFREGENSQDLYFILWGRLDVRSQGFTIASRHAGEFIGEIACLRNTTRRATVNALTPSALLKCSKEDLDLLLREHVELGRYLRDLAANRLIRIPG